MPTRHGIDGKKADIVPVLLVFVVLLGTIAYFEFRFQTIPDTVTVPGIVIGVGFVLGFEYITFVDSIAGVAIAFGGFGVLNAYWLRRRGRIGISAGDIKMVAMIGAFLGLVNAAAVLVVASMIRSEEHSLNSSHVSESRMPSSA